MSKRRSSTARFLALVALVVGGGLAVTYISLQSVRREADSVATNAYQQQQALIASQAAERLGALLRARGVEHGAATLAKLGDVPRLYARIFASLSGPYHAYVWVLNDERRVVAAPTASGIGSRPFERLEPQVARELNPVLAAMVRGERGRARYHWRAGRDHALIERLVAYTPVPGYPKLSLAYSANTATVAALTRKLQRRAQTTLLAVGGGGAATLALVLLLLLRTHRRERIALEQTALASRQLVHVEKLSTIGTLTASIGHEIKNPLATLMLNIEYMRRRARDDDTSRATLADLAAAAERIDEVVRGLGRLGRAQERHELCDVGEVVELALRLAKGQLEKLTVETDIARPLWAMAARGELTQVVLNLVVNAAQALGAAGGTLRVSAHARGDDDVVIEVTDDGPGIAAAVRDSLFQPFVTTKGADQGTGLGLHITRNIVTRHAGQIEVESEPGCTRFRVSLPRKQPTLSHRSSVESTPQAQRQSVDGVLRLATDTAAKRQ
ncbi:MAG: hypothetical protein KC503_02480 [Myxococcales bacterium]|nr:hypothetical protein [Myxococcales bacterium]